LAFLSSAAVFRNRWFQVGGAIVVAPAGVTDQPVPASTSEPCLVR
jgi:hypothetical protein